jgi:hypothetical protein
MVSTHGDGTGSLMPWLSRERVGPMEHTLFSDGRLVCSIGANLTVPGFSYQDAGRREL